MSSLIRTLLLLPPSEDVVGSNIYNHAPIFIFLDWLSHDRKCPYRAKRVGPCEKGKVTSLLGYSASVFSRAVGTNSIKYWLSEH